MHSAHNSVNSEKIHSKQISTLFSLRNEWMTVRTFWKNGKNSAKQWNLTTFSILHYRTITCHSPHSFSRLENVLICHFDFDWIYSWQFIDYTWKNHIFRFKSYFDSKKMECPKWQGFSLSFTLLIKCVSTFLLIAYLDWTTREGINIFELINVTALIWIRAISTGR